MSFGVKRFLRAKNIIILIIFAERNTPEKQTTDTP